MKLLRTLLVGIPLVLVPARSASAHTEPDVVAVPAGEPATVVLRPTHGCGGSPTVEVSTRVPVAGADAGDVEGWMATASQPVEGDDRTVIEWTGGSLPADQEGAFPVTFTPPTGSVGELVLLPFVQVCADGTELPWIGGDPESEYPAPRVLVLAPGSEPAATLDDVPADAPGRELLAEVVPDSDNPASTSTTTPEGTTTTADAAITTTPPAEDDDGDDGGLPWLPIVSGIVAVAGLTAFVVVRRGGFGS